MKEMNRNRYIYAMLLSFVILFGLYSRSVYVSWYVIQQFAGDISWALMIYFVFALLCNRIHIGKLFLLSIAFCFLIEGSQCFQYDWIVYLRTTPLYYLLGRGFLVSDLWCYLIGCLMGVGVDVCYTLVKRKRKEKEANRLL